jgi:hypothetical protein
MSPDNVETIRRLLRSFNRGDFGALNELDAGAELQDEPRIPGAGWNRGHEGAVDWAVKLWQSFGRVELEIVEPLDLGEAVVARWQALGEGKRSGAEVGMTGHCLFVMHGGKVRRVEFFETHDAALAAVPPSARVGRRSRA